VVIKHEAISSMEAEMLRQIRGRNDVSRVGLARLLHLAPSTAGAYVDRLISNGYLLERQAETTDKGRPPTLLSLNPRGGRFIGVDFEARNIMATAVDFSQKSLCQAHRGILATNSVDDVLGKIEDAVSELIGTTRGRLLGIGVGVPGIIDPVTQTGVYYTHIKDWERVEIGNRLRSRFGVPVFIENNIRSMAMAEMWFGQARGLKDFVCIGIRTGLAAGIVVGGKLAHGRSNLAGEIGQWLCPVAPLTQSDKGRDIAWDNDRLQPLEEIASVPALLASIQQSLGKSRSLQGEDFTIQKVRDAADKGDRCVIETLADIGETLGWVVCQIDSLVNPARIIFAGPLTLLGRHLIEPINAAVRKFGSEHHQYHPSVVFSDLGEYNGALGAAALALHEWRPKH
jgi:predicted NBD/HSP70 family sugar kinase